MVQRGKLAVALIGLWAVAGVTPALAIDDLNKGKTAQQLFTSDCAICHDARKKPGASMSQRQLATFLAQHYTINKSEAGSLAGYLTAVGEREPPRRSRRTRPKSRSKQPARPTSN